MNEYYRFLEKAAPFTTVDPRPYNREMRHIAEAFDKLPAASRMNTGTQYYARLVETTNPAVYRAALPAFPLSGKAGMRLYFIFPVDPAAGDVAIDVAVGDTILGPFLIRTAEGQAYPEGTLRKGVVYETVFRDDSVMQLLGAGSTVISVAQISVSRILGFAQTAELEALRALSERNESAVDLAYINSVIMPEAQYQLSRVNFAAATRTTPGLVTLAHGPVNAPPLSRAMSATYGKRIYDILPDKIAENHTHTYFAISDSQATTLRKGMVQLSSSQSDVSTIKAAAAGAVKSAYDRLATRADLEHDHDFSAISNPAATATQAGVFSLSDSFTDDDAGRATTAARMEWMFANIDMDSAPKVHTHPWDQIRPDTIPPASETVASVFKLVDDGTSTSVSDAITAAFGNVIRTGVNNAANTLHYHPLDQVLGDLPDPRVAARPVYLGGIATQADVRAPFTAVSPFDFVQNFRFNEQEGINSYNLNARGGYAVMMACYYSPSNAGIEVAKGQLIDTLNSNAGVLVPCAAENGGLTTTTGPRGKWRALSAAPNRKNNYTYPTLWLYERIATA